MDKVVQFDGKYAITERGRIFQMLYSQEDGRVIWNEIPQPEFFAPEPENHTGTSRKLTKEFYEQKSNTKSYKAI